MSGAGRRQSARGRYTATLRRSLEARAVRAPVPGRLAHQETNHSARLRTVVLPPRRTRRAGATRAGRRCKTVLAGQMEKQQANSMQPKHDHLLSFFMRVHRTQQMATWVMQRHFSVFLRKKYFEKIEYISDHRMMYPHISDLCPTVRAGPALAHSHTRARAGRRAAVRRGLCAHRVVHIAAAALGHADSGAL